MATVYDVSEKMHKMRAKLYPNYLPGGEGTYIARTLNEAIVYIRDIIASMIKRGGYSGSYDSAMEAVNHFLKETIYLLCDGFTVNLDYFTIHPNIGGVFQSEKEPFNLKEHSVDFRFQALKAMLEFRDAIEVILDGKADTNAYIDEFADLEQNSVNQFYTPGNGFSIHGHNIRVEGDDLACGVFFVPVQDPSKRVKVTRMLENNPSKIMGLCPSTGFTENRIEIVTQYSRGTNLKAPRTLTSSFTVEEV